MTPRHYLLAALTLMLAVASCKKDDVNKAPVADAGVSSSITIDSVNVTGTASDADGKVVAYLWSQVSGPVAATIAKPDAAATTIKFSVSGSYVFQLKATDDKGATGVDTMMVTVKLPTTLTLQPANNPGEYELTNLGGSDASGVAVSSIDANAWTANSNTYNIRSIVKFDLSSIPANATINSATLYLYSDPKPNTGNTVDANFGTANTALLQMITSSWSTGTVSWFNQPTVNTANQLTLSQAPQGKLDLVLDVKSHVATMVSTSANYGWMIRLQNETAYNSRIFCSSRNTNYPDKRPKLVVVYQ